MQLPTGPTLSVLEWGPADGPPALILHGYLDQALAWEQVAQGLAARGRRVIVPDQRGFGHSDHAGRYPFPEYVVDAQALCAAMDLERVDLIGHSMGATVAAMFAGALPERVRSLTLVEGLGPPSMPDAHALKQLRQHLSQRLAPRPHRPMSLEEAAQKLRRANPSLTADRSLRLAERGTRETEAGRIWRWDPAHRQRSATPFDLDRFLVFLRAIQSPTRLILGTRSWVRRLDRMAERKRAIGQLTLSELPCGHNPHLELPEALVGELESHLRALKATQT